MKALHRFGALLPLVLLLLSACESGTAPRIPEPDEPEVPADTVPSTGSLLPPPAYIA
jgi:hypothetical protein